MILDKTEYKTIISKLPKFCIDLVNVDHLGRVLLIKRREEPFKGFWSLPGGRLYFGESIVDGVERILNRELGCKGYIRKPLSVMEFIEEIEMCNCHSISLGIEIYLDKEEITLDNTSNTWERFPIHSIEILDMVPQHKELVQKEFIHKQ